MREGTITYFQSQGFNLTNNDELSIQFERGSILRNMLTFNPLKWKSIVEISFDKNDIIANFEINTVFQAVSHQEENLWQEFISNYQKTLQTNQSFISENEAQLKDTRKSSYQYVRRSMLGAIIFGLPGGLLAHLTGINLLMLVAVVGGGLLFLVMSINKDKSKTYSHDKDSQQ